jgi:hypothetical protein
MRSSLGICDAVVELKSTCPESSTTVTRVVAEGRL